jgi:hypothetical protein
MEMIMAKSRRGPSCRSSRHATGRSSSTLTQLKGASASKDGGQTWTEAAEPPRFSKAKGDEIDIVGALSGGH